MADDVIASLDPHDGGNITPTGEMTKEEAKAHVYEARNAGLMGQALYVELEQMVWGFRNDKKG